MLQDLLFGSAVPELFGVGGITIKAVQSGI